MRVIKWYKDTDPGFWESAEGRFAIFPEYLGRTTPQQYRVRDNMRRDVTTTYTVRQAKDWALERINMESNYG